MTEKGRSLKKSRVKHQQFAARFTPLEFMLWQFALTQCELIEGRWRIGAPLSAETLSPRWKAYIASRPQILANDVVAFFELLLSVHLLQELDAVTSFGRVPCAFTIDPRLIRAERMRTQQRPIVFVSPAWIEIARTVPETPRELLKQGGWSSLVRRIQEKHGLQESLSTTWRRLFQAPPAYPYGLGVFSRQCRDTCILPCWPGLSEAQPRSFEEKYRIRY